MQYQLLVALCFSAGAYAMPAVMLSRAANSTASSGSKAVAGSSASGAGYQVSAIQVGNAVDEWQADTGKVTDFLNTATSLTGDDFTKQATIALNSEKDELNHKMILDLALGNKVSAPNNILVTQGTFQLVVDTLQKMVTNGPDTAQADVDTINNDRCVNVLPAIDAYFAAAGSPTVSAFRPTGCLEVTATTAAVTATASAAVTTSAAVSDAATTAGTAQGAKATNTGKKGAN